MERQNEKILKGISRRAGLIYGVFVLVVVMLVLRIVQVQFASPEVAFNSERLRDKIIFIDSLEAHRGTIFSRDGRPLAESVFRKSIHFDFGSEGLDNDSLFDVQARALSRRLAEHFGDRSAAWYYKRMREGRDSCFVLRYSHDSINYLPTSWLGRLLGIWRDSLVRFPVYDTIRRHSDTRLFRDVGYDEWEMMRREFPILNGSMGTVTLQRIHDTRVYPYNRMAVISSEMRRERIEEVFREQLSGTDGYQWRQRIAPNFTGRVDDTDYREPVDGMDLVTTIDTDIQDIASEALHATMVEEEGVWGTCIVMECATGDIAAMVNLGRDGSKYVERRNYAAGTRLEPGSTFKLAVALALIDDAKMPTSRGYSCGNGKSVKLGETKTRVEDSHNVDKVAVKENSGRKTKVNMRCAFKESSNVYFAKAVLEEYGDEPQRLADYLRRELHLGECAGLDTIGEIAPRLHDMPLNRDYRRQSIDRLIHMGFGYGLELAPIQTLRLYNAVANGGCMVAPRIITQLRRGDKVVEEFPVRVIDESICSKEALTAVREFMKEAALTGTGKPFFGTGEVPYRTALKTGTARVSQGKITYDQGYYLCSMVGFLPVDTPRYTILTAVMKRSGTGAHKNPSGTYVAGKAHRAVSTFLYNRLSQTASVIDSDAGKRPVEIKGGDIASIRRVTDRLSPYTTFDSRSGWGRAKVEGSKGGVEITSLPGDMRRMPDVCGMGLSDALFLLESRGLRVTFKGCGKVTDQSIAAGSAIEPKMKVSIELK